MPDRLIKLLQDTRNERLQSRKLKRGHVGADGRIFVCYEKCVRKNKIVVREKWASKEAFARAQAKYASRYVSGKSKWQEFAICLINRLDQYEDTTDIRNYYHSLPR